jgi:hypothetical protein
VRPLLPLAVLLLLSALTVPATRGARAAPAGFNLLATQRGALTLRVARPGPVTITGAALSRAGWDLAQIDPRAVHLFQAGVEQPLALEGADDAALAPSSRLRFIARAPAGRFADAAVYWLAHDLSLGLRAPLPAYVGEPLRWEEAARYEGRFGDEAGDHWFSRELFAGRALSVTLALPAALPAGAWLRLRLLSEERRSHTLALSANGTRLPQVSWSDADTPAGQPQALVASVALPAPVPAGNLQIDLALVSAGLPTDVVLLDWIELPDVRVAAPEVLDPPLAPHDPLDLRLGPETGRGGADYLVVSHGDFVPALEPLLTAKRRAGRSPAVVNVQAAYDAWSYGERDPAAIRELLRAATAWRPAPRAVLLVGAGSVRGAPPPGERDENFIPPWLIDADPWLGEAACDSCYARLDADDPRDDPLPDVAIGRFPARTLAEAETLVRKTVAYETAPPAGAWRTNALFLADNDTLPDGTPDPVGGFAGSVEAAAALVEAAGLRTQRLLYDPAGGAGGYADVGALRCALFAAVDGAGSCSPPSALPAPAGREAASLTAEALRAQADDVRPTTNTHHSPLVARHSPDGAALLTYIGHGSPWQWAQTALDAPTPYLWYLYDADARRNGGRLPILLAMTCLTGAWQNPDLPTTDERLLLTPGGGIVASLSATGMGVNSGHDALLRGALPVLAGAGGGSLGDAHLAGLAELVRTGHNLDLAYTYGILGDPDVALPRAAPWQAFLPAVAR